MVATLIATLFVGAFALSVTTLILMGNRYWDRAIAALMGEHVPAMTVRRLPDAYAPMRPLRAGLEVRAGHVRPTLSRAA